MSGHYGIEAIAYHAGIRVSCRVPDASYVWRHGELIVEDTKTGARLALPRHEWAPLLKSIRQALRSASEALELVPADPVIRAVGRIPVKSHPAALARGAIMTRYHAELMELRQRHLARAEALTAMLTGPVVERESPSPHGGEGERG